jgi:hypothetical protein
MHSKDMAQAITRNAAQFAHFTGEELQVTY